MLIFLENRPYLRRALTERAALAAEALRRIAPTLPQVCYLALYTSPIILGILLLSLDLRRLHDSEAVMRTISLGILVSILTFTFEQLSEPSRDRLVLSSTPLPLRLLRSALAVVGAFSVLAIVRALVDKQGAAPAPLELWCLLSVLTVSALRLVPIEPSAVLLVGTPPSLSVLEHYLRPNQTRSSFLVIGSFDPQSGAELRQLASVAASIKNALIIVAADTEPDYIDLTCLSVVDSTARVVMTTFDRALLRSHFAASALATRVAFLPIIDVMPAPIQGWNQIVKRSIDVIIVLLALPMLAPVFAVVAIAIKVSSPGPVFFRQLRYGQRSKPVLIAKFRTMRHDSSDLSGVQRTIARDPRVTSVGRVLRRLSIDELPQIFSVLSGDMSLVGPRPHPTGMKVEGELYDQAVKAYRVRHRFPPGLTGWAQVNGSRGAVDSLAKAERRIALDLWYLSNWSPLLDVWIILRTAFGGFATLKAD